MQTSLWLENLKGKDLFGGLDVDCETIQRWLVEGQNMSVCNGFISLTLVSSVPL
jgi:hypothetical protein